MKILFRILEADELFWTNGGWDTSDLNSLQDFLLLHKKRQVKKYNIIGLCMYFAETSVVIKFTL
jgi:hypothetical protein